jgi:lactoylglutathione lyase
VSATELHHTGISVSNLERSIEFYSDVLGMRVVMRQEKQGGYLERITGYPGAHVSMAQLELPGGGHRLELFEYIQPKGRTEAADPCDVGITHACFVVDDLQAVYERLQAAGVSCVSAPVEIDTGANRGGAGLYARDPDGAVVELFQAPRRTEGA